MKLTQPDFDGIARPYKFLEYLTLGTALQKCRTHHLPALIHQKNALVLGDGDGRFLAQLLATNEQLQADVVDTSGAMLSLLATRCLRSSPTAADRLRTHHCSAQEFADSLSPERHYDLIVTHFFLDCLTQAEVETLIKALTPHLSPEALWLVSDFRIPPQGMIRSVAKMLIRGLYLAFRIVTGLRTSQLPDHESPFAAAGLTCVARHRLLQGLLTTEIWQRH
jgi:hypothetical protein